MAASGLTITPAATVDPSKAPDNMTASVRTDTGGRHQVRVTVSPSPSGDPADPKPADHEKPEAKVEDKPAASETPTQRPQWLPAKFETPDALKAATIELATKQGAPGYVIAGLKASESGAEVSAAYAEFEKKIDPNAGKPAEKQPEAPAKTPEEQAAADAEAKKTEAQPFVKDEATKAHERETYGEYVATMLDKVGVSAVSIGEEFAANGNKLTDATYEKFAKAGVAKPFLDAYISGMVGNARTLAENHVKEVKSEIFGGEEGFSTVAVWASANLTKDQHEVYTTMTSSGNLAVAKEAARMLKGWHEKANGTPAKVRIVPDAPAVPENKGYATRQEMMNDMNSSAYKRGDRGFHKQVEEKLKHTDLSNI